MEEKNTYGTCQLHFFNFNFAQELFWPPFFQNVAFPGSFTTIEPGRFAVVSIQYVTVTIF